MVVHTASLACMHQAIATSMERREMLAEGKNGGGGGGGHNDADDADRNILPPEWLQTEDIAILAAGPAATGAVAAAILDVYGTDLAKVGSRRGPWQR